MKPYLPLLATLLAACTPEPTAEELWGGRWEVRSHVVAPDCTDPAPADPAWTALEVSFVDLQGFTGAAVARCEGGCDVPNFAVPLDTLSEDLMFGVSVEAGLFAGTKGDFCQGSVGVIDAERTGEEEAVVRLRTFFGSFAPPADGDCDAELLANQEQVCDELTTYELVR